jgi:virginiamycin B lyase
LLHLTAGPDGNLWYTEYTDNKIGRLTTTGTLTEFPLPTAHSGPTGITTGPDGNLWFTEATGQKLGRITPSGVITEFALPQPCGPQGITAGPDGNLWIACVSTIARITP